MFWRNLMPVISQEHTVKSKLMLIINFISFQLGWFVCVLGGDQLSLLIMLPILLLHFFVVAKNDKINELLTVLAISISGILIDSFVISQFIIDYKTPVFIPLWIACLWVLFASTIRHSLSWLDNYLFMVPLLGAIAGALSYLAGVNLSSAEFYQPGYTGCLFIAANWYVVTPLSFIVARRFTKAALLNKPLPKKAEISNV